MLNKLTLYLRQDGNSSNAARVDILKNSNGFGFSTATSIANSTLTLGLDSVSVYTFSGLTINQYDSLHVQVTPGTGGANNYFGIVTIE